MDLFDADATRTFESLSRVVGQLMTRLVKTGDSFREETITDLLVMLLGEANLAAVRTIIEAGRVWTPAWFVTVTSRLIMPRLA